MPLYIERIANEGIEIQKRYLGHLVGYFTTEIGPLNQIVHMWAYHDLEDRTERRAALAADEAWIAFMPRIQELIEEMECRILTGTSFSPLQ